MKSLLQVLNESLVYESVSDSKVKEVAIKVADLLIAKKLNQSISELEKIFKDGLTQNQFSDIFNFEFNQRMYKHPSIYGEPVFNKFLDRFEDIVVSYFPQLNIQGGQLKDYLMQKHGRASTNTQAATSKAPEITDDFILFQAMKNEDFSELEMDYNWTPEMINALKNCMYVEPQGGYLGPDRNIEWSFEYEFYNDMSDFYQEALSKRWVDKLKKNKALKQEFGSKLNKVKSIMSILPSGYDQPALFMFVDDSAHDLIKYIEVCG